MSTPHSIESVPIPEVALEPEDTDDDLCTEDATHDDMQMPISSLERISLEPPDIVEESKDADAAPVGLRVASNDSGSMLSSAADDPPKLRRASEESEMDTDTEIEQLTKGIFHKIVICYLLPNGLLCFILL